MAFYRLKDCTAYGDVGNPVCLPFSNTLMLLIFGAQDSDSELLATHFCVRNCLLSFLS